MDSQKEKRKDGRKGEGEMRVEERKGAREEREEESHGITIPSTGCIFTAVNAEQQSRCPCTGAHRRKT